MSTITGTILASNTNTVVLNELIDQTLLAQAAAENGYSVDETLLQSRISALESQLGGVQALKDWQAENSYNDETFKVALKRSIGAAWMQNQLIAEVPETADEVHVLQILLPTQAEADEVYSSLQSGKDFQQVVSTFDPVTQGDLGWFSRDISSNLLSKRPPLGCKKDNTVRLLRPILDITSSIFLSETLHISSNPTQDTYCN